MKILFLAVEGDNFYLSEACYARSFTVFTQIEGAEFFVNQILPMEFQPTA